MPKIAAKISAVSFAALGIPEIMSAIKMGSVSLNSGTLALWSLGEFAGLYASWKTPLRVNYILGSMIITTLLVLKEVL